MVRAFSEIWNNGQAPPKHLWTDKGKEFINKKFKIVLMYHIIYLIACPFVGMWECFVALKAAFCRDFK